MLVCRAAAVAAPPSSRTAANELSALSTLSNLVPDTLQLESPVFKPKAATVAAPVLRGVLASGQLGLKPFVVSWVSQRGGDGLSGVLGSGVALGEAAAPRTGWPGTTSTADSACSG